MTPMPATVAFVIVDTLQHTLAHNALLHSLRAFEPHQVLIFSDRQAPWGDLPIIPTPALAGTDDYNRLIVGALPEHLRSDFCIVLQYDGFVINPAEFSPHFFHYDYIGAPWPHFASMKVGNGGFSWRSRKLVEAAAALPYEDLSFAEDLFICRQERPRLEQDHGIRFAPPELAAHFSVESVGVPFPTFGFHGIFHLPNVYRESIDFLVDQLNPGVARKWQHLLLPAIEQISLAAAARMRQRIAHAFPDLPGQAI